MWKDLFSFSRGEKRAIIVLSLLIVFLQVTLWTTDYWVPLLPEYFTKASAHRKALKVFKDSLSENKYSPYNELKYKDKNTSGYSKSVRVKLVAFNPNTADSAVLVSLGLKPYVAKNILKYRKKGGVFRKAEDFARIYGIEPAQFEQLSPFIRIPEQSPMVPKEEKTAVSISVKDGLIASPKQTNAVVNAVETPAISLKPAGFINLDINRLDTATLQQLKGVSRLTANRITQYRDKLGGFYSTRQLEEIKGIYPDVLSRLQAMLKMDTTRITKINANKASLEKLKAHPYISFYQAKVIVELRKARSGIKNINELEAFKEFAKEDIDRLRWYLSF